MAHTSHLEPAACAVLSVYLRHVMSGCSRKTSILVLLVPVNHDSDNDQHDDKSNIIPFHKAV